MLLNRKERGKDKDNKKNTTIPEQRFNPETVACGTFLLGTCTVHYGIYTSAVK